ncbi:MAG: glycoside hydrolase family 38 C-terminal domain-containing protein, partial [Acutalibacteraceae bacterium]
FGNISQSPQILRGFGIDNCAFGRGVTPVAANNTVQSGGNVQKSSEFIWSSPDGSSVIGVLFAHWYHNAMEIPSDHDLAVERLKKIISSTKEVSSTPHLLGMNGCDHQPVQINIGDIIEKVQDDFPDVEIRHSNFRDYMALMHNYTDRFPPINGELYGQNTNGYHTLVNTASARVYMKQANHLNQMTLEKQTEPLSVIAYNFGGEYKQDLINHSWRELLKNHAHDSICGCSVDPVHRECMSRFEKSTATAESVRDSAVEYLENNIKTEFCDAEKVVMVYNPNSFAYSQTVTANVDISLDDTTPKDEFGVFTADGIQLSCDVEDLGRTFTYVLPRHSFRKVTYYRRLKVTFTACGINPCGYETFVIKKIKKPVKGAVRVKDLTAENDFIKIKFNEDGTFDLYDKESKQSLKNLGYFEESGDAGDEYNFIPPKTDKVYTTLGAPADISVEKSNTQVKFTVKQKLKVPATCTKEKRCGAKKTILFESVVTIGEKSRMADIMTTIENNAENHRIRAMFPNNIKTKIIRVDGQYDLLERPVDPGEKWVNPDNSQRVQSFIMLNDDKKSMVVANRGLEEYEVLRDKSNTAAITLLRCVGFLGDWGIFPTPEAQCKGKNTAHYAVGVCGKDNAGLRREGYAFATGTMLTMQAKPVQDGTIPNRFSFVSLEGENSIVSAVKKAEEDGGIIVRFYNPTEKAEKVKLHFGAEIKSAVLTNLNEEEQGSLEISNGVIAMDSPKKKITTIKVKLK